jgi:hypothetical protein
MTRLGKLASAVLLAVALLTSIGLVSARAASAQTTAPPPPPPNGASVQFASDQVAYLRWGEHRPFGQVTKIYTGSNTEVQFDTDTELFVVQPNTCQSFASVDGLVGVSPR